MNTIIEYKQYGESLDATLTPDEGYSNMKVKITKEDSNTDFTSDYFNPSNNKIHIDYLHENVTIDAVALNVEGINTYTNMLCDAYLEINKKNTLIIPDWLKTGN